jgi:hypothetical protein
MVAGGGDFVAFGVAASSSSFSALARLDSAMLGIAHLYAAPAIITEKIKSQPENFIHI